MPSIQVDKTDVKFVHELMEWRMPVVTATQQAEAGGSLQPVFKHNQSRIVRLFLKTK